MIKDVKLLDYYNCDASESVKREIEKIWADYELGNDNSYFSWDSEDFADDYPLIDDYLKYHGVTQCLIHYCW